MSANDKLAKWGLCIKRHKAGGLRLYSVNSSQAPGEWVECSVAEGSPMIEDVRQAFAELGSPLAQR